jgi:hypothetical protein
LQKPSSKTRIIFNKRKIKENEKNENHLDEYFSEIDKGLKPSFSEKEKFFLSCCGFFHSTKIEDLKEVTMRIKKRNDIVNIIKKIIELDRLRILLLDENQFKLLDFLPKPRIKSIFGEAKHPTDLCHSTWKEHFEEENSNCN